MSESILRPKFKTVFIKKSAPSDPKLDQLKFWCGKFIESGLMPAHESGLFGNLSFRVREGSDIFIITASGAKDIDSSGTFVKVTAVDLGKQVVSVEGMREPSSETLLHYLVYSKRKDIGAVFHGHSTDVMNKAKARDLPETSEEFAYGTHDLAKSVADIIDNRLFVIMKGHGFVSAGKDMDDAGNRVFSLL